jgi:SSS family transporter
MADVAIWGGVALYLAAVMAIGVGASRRIADNADYIVAGRRLPAWLCTFTLFATWFGGGTALGAAGAAYDEGLRGVIADPFGAALCLFVFGAFYARVLRRLELLTVADFFRRRFGGHAEPLAALCLIPAYLGWVGSQFVAFGFVLNALTGFDTTTAIVGGAAFVVLYTMAGGLWAVSLTDAVQAAVLTVGLGLLLAAVLTAPGNEGAWGAIPEAHWAFAPEPGWPERLAWVQAWLVIGLGAIPSQDLLQRALAARSDGVAAGSAHAAGTLYLTVGLLPVLLGMLGAVLLPGLDNPELVVPRLCLEYLPPLGIMLVLGALLSAIMSSADSALLAPAGIVSENLARWLRPDLSDAARLRISRVVVPAFGALALAVALWFENVYDLMVSSWSVMLVSLLVPLTGGIYWRRPGRVAASGSMGAGLVAWIGLLRSDTVWPADLLAAGVGLAVFVALGALGPASRDAATGADGGTP